ncbi:MAG: zinc metallopeptidase [Desulfobacterales bacterium]|nr:zinc metallopeptidase [Desulfobacterales bacterium]MCP4162555.1 zinc metallopeptidase [Deltaproteobacteria bacterium]
MHYFLLIIFIIVIFYGPSIWMKRVLNRYNYINDNYPGTGFEFAEHLMKVHKMDHVKVEMTEGDDDHYDHTNKKIVLSSKYASKKSLTSVAIAAHEAAHAIQDNHNYPPYQNSIKTSILSYKIRRAGYFMMLLMPVAIFITRVPATGILLFIISFISMATPVFTNIMSLPVEFDASFNRALPILRDNNYIPDEDLEGARKILTACAFTYVAASLSNIFNFWNWLRR